MKYTEPIFSYLITFYSINDFIAQLIQSNQGSLIMVFWCIKEDLFD
jgi:hypothetical protein